MGWFFRDEPQSIEFDAVVGDDGTIWYAWTDDDGVLWIDSEDDVTVVVEGVIIGGRIYPAWVLDDGTLWIPD